MRAFSRSRPRTGSAWRCASAALRGPVRLSPGAAAWMRRPSSSARSGTGPPVRGARCGLRAALPRPPRARSDRDVVVEVVALPAAPAGGLLGKGRGPAAGPAAGRALGGAAHGSRARPAAATAEHLQIVADDLGRIAVVSLLILPLARAQAPLDVDLRALAQVLARDLREPPEERHAMPLGALLLLAALLVAPAFAGRHAQVRDRGSGGHRAGLGIGPQVADENDFIDATRHGVSPCSELMDGAGRSQRPRVSLRPLF